MTESPQTQRKQIGGHPPRSQLRGMPAFILIWFGQLVSLLGTGMSRFALTIWAWEITGNATALALVGFFSFAPSILLSPVAGALVDRWNRKFVMMVSDLAAGVATLAILLLHLNGELQLWHLYVAGAFTGVFEPFQFPAFSAAITLMVNKTHYTRASGLLSIAESATTIAAPILAGIFLAWIGLSGLLIIDIVTFSFAVSTLAFVFIPQPPPAPNSGAAPSLWQETLFGFRYILARPSLLGLQTVFLAGNLTGTMGFVLLAPMILARTGNNELMLGSVQSALGVGGVVGGVLLSLWGGPQRRVHGVLLGFVGMGLLGQAVIGAGRSLPVWLVGAFLSSFFLPFINGSNQAIWQAKVPPAIQGRVFAARRVFAQLTAPIAMLLAGPLADYLFEPAMQPRGWLAPIFGPLVGTGPGAGMGVLMLITGLVGTVAALAGYGIRAIREAEEILPDHEAALEHAA